MKKLNPKIEPYKRKTIHPKHRPMVPKCPKKGYKKPRKPYKKTLEKNLLIP
jgi:hypothetical protein